MQLSAFCCVEHPRIHLELNDNTTHSFLGAVFML